MRTADQVDGESHDRMVARMGVRVCCDVGDNIGRSLSRVVFVDVRNSNKHGGAVAKMTEVVVSSMHGIGGSWFAVVIIL